MKITHYTTIESKQFDTGPAKGVTGRVAIGRADGAQNFCMRVFELAKDGFSPKHTHDWEHEILVHRGEGEVFNDGKWSAVSAGFVIFIPGGEEHQLRNTGDEDFVFACVIPKGVQEL